MSTSNPVANGSSVPVWPVRAPVRRRSSATSANEDGPAGLVGRATATGLLARGGIRRPLTAGRGDELTPDERRDLVDRKLAREARRLPVASAAGLARDCRHVDLVLARPQRDPPRRPAR